jgi:hypothetical protein
LFAVKNAVFAKNHFEPLSTSLNIKCFSAWYGYGAINKGSCWNENYVWISLRWRGCFNWVWKKSFATSRRY